MAVTASIRLLAEASSRRAAYTAVGIILTFAVRFRPNSAKETRSSLPRPKQASRTISRTGKKLRSRRCHPPNEQNNITMHTKYFALVFVLNLGRSPEFTVSLRPTISRIDFFDFCW
jgi:hypothetical protein